MSEATRLLSPFVGLVPFTEDDAPFFFGREAERDLIIENLYASRLTLLYGSSGVGKSSVLYAGVAYRLWQIAQQDVEQYGTTEFAVVTFNAWRDDPIHGLLRSIHEAVTRALQVRSLEGVPQSGGLTGGIRAWTERYGIELLIILDQFEEYFQYPHETGEGTFAQEFPRAVNDYNLRIKFLISLRDDALSKLDRFKPQIPGLFDNLLRIRHMDSAAAREAIVKPIAEYNRRYICGEERQEFAIELELVEEVIRQVQVDRDFAEHEGGAEPAGIEAPYLQLVMTRLWEKEREEGSCVLRKQTLEDLKGIKNIVQVHLNDALEALTPEQKAVASCIFDYLVTPSGTKIAYIKSDLVKRTKYTEGQIDGVVAALNKSRILRSVDPPPGQLDESRYEVFHDLLAQAILNWQTQYMTAAKLAKTERRGLWAVRVVDLQRQLLAELQKELEPLARHKLLAVGGESAQLDGLQRLLDQALTELSALGQVQEHDQVDERINQIEEVLMDPAWEVTNEIREELKRKAGQQQAIIQQFQIRLGKWLTLLDETRDALTSAVRARAPVRQEEIEFPVLEARITQAQRAFLEGRYADLQTLMQQLDESPAAQPEYLTRIRAETAKADLFLRQADLLLLQSPLDIRGLYHYTVLLRTSSEPGTHGINILHASCALVKQDRDEMSASIAQITAAVNREVTRDFEARLSTFKAPPPMDGTSSPAASATASGVAATSLPNAGPPAANLNDLVQDLGDLMYRIFVPDQLQDYLYESPCSLTITTNDLELPWELMVYKDKHRPEENKFLCLERPVARMPMGRYLPRRHRSVRTDRKQLSFLLIYADPWANLAFAEREVEKIETELRSQWGEQIAIRVLSGPQASGRELTKVLRQDTYDVIHFAGHAYFDDQDGDLSGLLLHNGELLLAQKVRLLLAGQPLVFLNASPSGSTANEAAPQQIERYLQGPAEGLASAFIYGGALGCVSSLWPIYDEPAADFAIHFYNHVVSGYMVGEALRLARCRIKEDYDNQITWAAYVLYGDPTLQL